MVFRNFKTGDRLLTFLGMFQSGEALGEEDGRGVLRDGNDQPGG